MPFYPIAAGGGSGSTGVIDNPVQLGSSGTYFGSAGPGRLTMCNSGGTISKFIFGIDSGTAAMFQGNGSGGVQVRRADELGDLGMSGVGFASTVTPALSAPQFTNVNTASAGLHINGSTGVPSLTFTNTKYMQVTNTAFVFEGAMPLTGARVQSLAFTSSQTVTAQQSGASFTNAGATGAITFTLPTPVLGLAYWFTVRAAFALNVTTPSGIIYVGAVTTGATRSNSTVGSAMRVVCDGTNWYADDYSATTAWT